MFDHLPNLTQLGVTVKIRTAANMLPFIFLVEMTKDRPLRIPNMGQRLCKRPGRDPPPPMRYKNPLLRYNPGWSRPGTSTYQRFLSRQAMTSRVPVRIESRDGAGAFLGWQGPKT